MRTLLRYWILLAAKLLVRTFYRADIRWLAPPPPAPWLDLRVICILNHTSLFDWLLVTAGPNHLLKEAARRGVVPVADKTLRRPIVGLFFKALVPGHMPISREADHTWEAVLSRVGDTSMVIILPEGRMMRANGLDKNGQPMTVRGGVADILSAIPDGRMLLAYSGGMHHIQAPGRLLPRPFKRIRVALELVDIANYKAAIGEDLARKEFKDRVKRDLQERRDRHCPPGSEGT